MLIMAVPALGCQDAALLRCSAWDAKDTPVLDCKILKEKAEEFKAVCASVNTSVNAVFLAAIDRFMDSKTVVNNNGKTVVSPHSSTVAPVHSKEGQALQRAQPAPEAQQAKPAPKRYPFTVDLPQYLNERCKGRHERTHRPESLCAAST